MAEVFMNVIRGHIPSGRAAQLSAVVTNVLIYVSPATCIFLSHDDSTCNPHGTGAALPAEAGS